MATNQNFIRYEEENKLEVFGPSCIKARDMFDDIRKEIKAESKQMAGFITVREFSKDLSNKQNKIRA